MENALLDLPEHLVTVIRSLFRDEPLPAPRLTPAQWNDLLCALRPHQMIPLLFWRMATLPPSSRPPEAVFHELRLSFLRSRVRSMCMERQLAEIFAAFHKEGIESLVLKGPALSQTVYPDAALRPYCDLDLLVHPDQMVKARQILEHLDYQCLGKRYEISKEFFHDEIFIPRNGSSRFIVELHWTLWELHPLNGRNSADRAEMFFENPSKVRSSDLIFETLQPVDAIIHAATHLILKHGRGMQLIWIYDIALLARQLSVPQDWKILQQRSVAWEGRLALEKALEMAQFWFGLQLPKGFNDFACWPSPAAAEFEILNSTEKSHWTRILLKRWLTRPANLLKMVCSFFRLLFPAPDIVRHCYPVTRRWLLPLSYMRRWRRWCVELIVKFR